MNITPGPWRSTRHSHNMVKVENKDRVIFDGFHGEEGNALLAAAAPELLEALHAMAKIIGPPEEPTWADDDQIEAAWNLAIAAIHKATQPTP